MLVSQKSLLAQDLSSNNYEKMGTAFFDKGDFPRAIEEFERALIINNSSAKSNLLSLKLAQAYLGANRFSEAQIVIVTRLSEFLSAKCSDLKLADVCSRTKWLYATLLWQMQQLVLLDSFIDQNVEAAFRLSNAKERRLESRLRILRGYSLLFQNSTDEAIKIFEDASNSREHDLQAVGKGVTAVIHSYDRKPYNPTLAGFLSIVPGLGQIYSGSYGAAFVAFFLNAVSMYFTFDSYEKARSIPDYSYGAAVGWGGLSSTLYSANIYNAVKSADARNEENFQNMKSKAASSGLSQLLKFEF